MAEPNYSGVVNLLEALAAIGPRQCGTEAAARAAEAVAEAFRGLGLEPRFEEFPLLGYDAEEPELWIDGERWRVGPCMYSHPGECEGAVRRLSDGVWAVGEGRLLRSLFGALLPLLAMVPLSASLGHLGQQLLANCTRNLGAMPHPRFQRKYANTIDRHLFTYSTPICQYKC